MSTLVLDTEPAAATVALDSEFLTVMLEDGRELRIPIAWYPRLAAASPAERNNWRLLGHGYAVEWPDLDEHIGVEGLLAGRRSGESAASFAQWSATRSGGTAPAP